MNEKNHTSHDDAMLALLDRLVCDEIGEADRANLVNWLEYDPARWRVCGLAFLEAQMWSRSLLDASITSAAHSDKAILPIPHERETSPVHWAGVASLICAVAVAFALGWNASSFANRSTTESPLIAEEKPLQRQNDATGEPILASVPLKTNLVSTATVQIPVVPRDDEEHADASRAIPEYVVRQWERRGYRVSLETRYLTAQLPDGKPVMVPVERLSLRRIDSQVN